MKTLFVAAISFYCISARAQAPACIVETESLKGSYEGECNKGKAHGEGKAVGVDTYEGSFRNGYPDGKGKYTWKNGDYYYGGWRRGVKEGKGELHLPVNGEDSVIAGYWKKDVYKGQYEEAFKIYTNSSDIGRVAISKFRGTTFSITVTVENLLSGGSLTNSRFATNTRMTDNKVTRGSFQTKSSNALTNREVTTFQGVIFPFRIWMYFGNSNVEIEFFEEGSYDVTVPINK